MKPLDRALVAGNLASSRAQAADLVRRGFVTVNGRPALRVGSLVGPKDRLAVSQKESFVSRAGEKLASVEQPLQLHFKGKVVLDVGSSTGGFSQLALRRGAAKVVAVDIGSRQMAPIIRREPRLELHEKTDIRQFKMSLIPDIVLIDVSFISIRQILTALIPLLGPLSQVIAMVKPQFEAEAAGQKHHGVIKNDTRRRAVLKQFEEWVRDYYIIEAKADSAVTGIKGNRERFYRLSRSLVK